MARHNILAILAEAETEDIAQGDLYGPKITDNDGNTLPLYRVTDDALSGAADAWLGLRLTSGGALLFIRSDTGNWLAVT